MEKKERIIKKEQANCALLVLVFKKIIHFIHITCVFKICP